MSTTCRIPNPENHLMTSNVRKTDNSSAESAKSLPSTCESRCSQQYMTYVGYTKQTSCNPAALDIQHTGNVNSSDGVQRLRYDACGKSRNTGYQQINPSIQSAGSMSWLPTFMKSFQEDSESMPQGLEMGTSCSLANSIMREEISCKSFDITSSDRIHDLRTSPLYTALQDSFSDILANCLSHISFGLDIHSNKDSVPTTLRNETGKKHSVPTTLRNETGMKHSVPTTLRNETGMSPIFHHSNEQPSASCETKVNRCYICYKILRSSRSLLTHMQRHVTLPGFTCPECGKSFYKSSDLKKHKYIHKDSKPYACDICCSCFNQKSNMVRHRKLHLRRKI